ncbi:chloramphenicol phosphotransferase CPT [Streptomyces sp. NPDC050145]|uniref:chloramphenicol phosphotransferase CPT n=1 Tax=Streptomyces sp. NPDC050145 TaxID=3365602 RepID=UPI00379B34C9
MTTRMIILNGGSSAGKSGIVRCLQELLPEPWLAFGADSFVDALPARMQSGEEGIDIAPDGTVQVGEAFRTLETAWTEGVVTMARAGARIVIDEIFLGGAASQRRWLRALGDLDALWVGVHCEPEVAAEREVARGDRTRGMAAAQAKTVHEGVVYDLEVDTTSTGPMECARVIAARVA